MPAACAGRDNLCPRRLTINRQQHRVKALWPSANPGRLLAQIVFYGLLMQDSIEIIHIEWNGPFTFSEIKRFTGEIDYGVYQIYGGHPLYGSNALVYIGKARDQCFGVRIPQEKYWQDNRDANRLNVYLGRLAGAHTPTDDVWGRQIDLAERLLIFAHSPANNTRRTSTVSMPTFRTFTFSTGVIIATYCQRSPVPAGRAS
jgi:hypothetical protein